MHISCCMDSDDWIKRVPPWARMSLLILTVAGSVYCIARFGLLSFLMHVIFSPVP